MPSSATTTWIFILSLHDALPILHRILAPYAAKQPKRGQQQHPGHAPEQHHRHRLPARLRHAQPRKHLALAIGVVTEHPLVPLVRKDRKSTRLNSSHTVISYAVFCDDHLDLHSFPTRRSSDLAPDPRAVCREAAKARSAAAPRPRSRTASPSSFASSAAARPATKASRAGDRGCNRAPTGSTGS